MTLDHAVALSLVENLPRVNLTDRLKNDANLLSRATPLLEKARAIRARAERAGIQVVAWNDARFPAALTTLTDLPPVLWYEGHLSATELPALGIVGSRAASAVAIETASRLAADVSEPHDRRPRVRSRSGLSGRARVACEGDCARWPGCQRVSARLPAAQASLSDAQSFDQRAFAWGRCNRGF